MSLSTFLDEIYIWYNDNCNIVIPKDFLSYLCDKVIKSNSKELIDELLIDYYDEKQKKYIIKKNRIEYIKTFDNTKHKNKFKIQLLNGYGTKLIKIN